MYSLSLQQTRSGRTVPVGHCEPFLLRHFRRFDGWACGASSTCHNGHEIGTVKVVVVVDESGVVLVIVVVG